MNIPQMTLQGLTCYNRSKAYVGFTLFCPLSGKAAVWLIDMEGRFVHQWMMPYRPGAYGRLLPNGNLLYECRILGGPLDVFGGSAAKIIEVDWGGNTVWEYSDVWLSHDFYPMSNGNIMVIRWAPMPENVSRKVRGGLPGTEYDGVMYGDCLREITRDGEVAWEWIGYEHMDPVLDVLCPLCTRSRWANANSVFVLDNGDVLVCFRHTNTLVIIDKETGEIKWRWGPGDIAHAHDAQILDNGNILVFDNGVHRSFPGPGDNVPSYSRVLELDPDKKEIAWEYKDEVPMNFYSWACGGCQRLPNGNTLICESFAGRIFEVTAAGEIVWEYVVPFYDKHPSFGVSNIIFRAYRYGPDYPGLQGKSLIPGNIDVILRQKPLQEEAVQERLNRLGY